MRKRSACSRILALLLVLCQLVFLPMLLAAATELPANEEEAEIPRAVFGNRPVTDIFLDVTKTVTAKEGVTLPEGWENKQFGFTIKENGAVKGNFPFVYIVDGVETGSGFTNANGHFTLKHGQIVRFTEIQPGAEYTVIEEPEDNSHYSLIQPYGSDRYSEIINEAKRWEFINEYQPDILPDSHVFRIEKKVNFPQGFRYDWDDEFTFLLTLDGEPARFESYSVWDQNGRHVRDSQTNSEGHFILRANEIAEFEVTETDYRIEELLSADQVSAGWQVIGNVEYSGAVQTAGTKTFTNARADLMVHKVLADNSTASDIFTFQLIDKDNRGIQGATYYLYDRLHELVEITWGSEREQPLHTGADGSFTLKAGQYAMFVDLDVKAPPLQEDDAPDREDGRQFRQGDVIVKVSEQYIDGYNLEQTLANSSYHKIDGSLINLEFRNALNKRSGLYISKVVNDVLPNEISPETVDFHFTLYKKDNNGDWQPYKANYSVGEGVEELHLSTDNEGHFSIKKTQTAKFNLLPLGEYKVTEELTGATEYILNTEDSLMEGEVVEGTPLELYVTNNYKPRMLDIVITKTDQEDDSIFLKGAEFSIYTDETIQHRLRVSEESTVTENGVTKYLYSIYDLKPGLYYLVETRAPLGYYTYPKAIKLRVEYNQDETGLVAYIYDENGNETLITDTALSASLFSTYMQPKLDEFDQQMIGADGFPLNDDVFMTIPNRSGDILPQSGGIAPWVYALGTVLAACGGIVLLQTRVLPKKKRMK